jgi:hypothetical protein
MQFPTPHFPTPHQGEFVGASRLPAIFPLRTMYPGITGIFCFFCIKAKENARFAPSHTDRQRSKVTAHAAPQSPKGEKPPAPKPNYPFSPHFPCWKETFINSEATRNHRPAMLAPRPHQRQRSPLLHFSVLHFRSAARPVWVHFSVLQFQTTAHAP